MASNAAAIGFLSLLGRRYRARRQRVTDHGFATDDAPQGKPVTGDIPALIAWWNVLFPAIGLSSPKPPTAVARRARLYRPMAGNRQSNLRSDNAHNVGSGASGASPWGQLFAIYARIVKTADMSFSELRIVWGRSRLIGTAGFVIVVDQVEQLHIVVAPDQLPEFIEQFDDGEGLLRRPVSGNAEGDGQEQAGGGRFHEGLRGAWVRLGHGDGAVAPIKVSWRCCGGLLGCGGF